ncbi:MAG: sigma-70 family RNA polymerase sigma factor, partial [Planctomycetota bacterium]
MSDPNPESTVADVSWLSALARTLTRDGALADDLVQETWLIARRASPEAAQSRPWLARVLRRLHLRSRRTESRRAAREKASGRSESLVGTAELVERAELQRVLAQSLLELEEPYRTTLMRVAFEGYSTARIAEAESVSVETVRRRLRRARELYARKLEHDHGHDWRHWYAALLPYAKVSPPSESSPPGPEDLTLTGKSTLSLKAWIMSNSTLLTVSALVAGIVAASLALFADRQDASPAGRPEIALGRADDVEPLSVPSPSSPETPARREPMTGAASVPDPAAVDRTTAPLSYVLRGTLTMRDAEGLQNPSASGSFALWTSTGTLQVPVERGAWSVELAPDQEISFRIRHDEEVRMDGRIGWLTGGTDAFASKSVLDRDTEIALRGRWPAEHRLLVLDAETGAHLSGVQVIECSDVDGAFPHPSSRANGTQVHENALSPLRIVPRARHRSDYLVGCSGFAWTTIALDHDEPGTTEVALRPGADLTVRFGGEESGPIEFAIQELGDPRRRSERGLASTDPVRLQGLPTGNYLLQARAGMRAAVVQAEVELLAGPNEVELDLPRRSDATV